MKEKDAGTNNYQGIDMTRVAFIPHPFCISTDCKEWRNLLNFIPKRIDCMQAYCIVTTSHDERRVILSGLGLLGLLDGHDFPIISSNLVE